MDKRFVEAKLVDAKVKTLVERPNGDIRIVDSLPLGGEVAIHFASGVLREDGTVERRVDGEIHSTITLSGRTLSEVTEELLKPFQKQEGYRARRTQSS